MNRIVLENVYFTYPDMDQPILKDLSIELPDGVVSLIGQNGTGKSTFLLLAGGSAVPDSGRVLIDGVDTRELRDERERQRYVSFIFQNMEFDTQEPIGDLLDFVYGNGFHLDKDPAFVRELVTVFELGKFLGKRTQEISKGELQRTILAFSLLYGSRILVMDEPIFAMEPLQKTKAMKFLLDYARENQLAVYYSAHELDITQKFSDYLMIFYKDGRTPHVGPKDELYQREVIEEAYEVPLTMLKTKEAFFREALTRVEESRR